MLPATARLTVLYVAHAGMLTPARPDPTGLRRALPAARRRHLAEGQLVAEQEAILLGAGPITEAASRWGHPIQEILRAASLYRSDLIVMGAKGHSNLSLILLGSISHGVVQHSRRPVLIARPGARDVRRIVIGYDGSGPARLAVEFLQRLALPEQVSFCLAYAVEPFAVPARMPLGYREQALREAKEINERQHAAATKALETLASQVRQSGRQVDTQILSGPAGAELHETARKQAADLVVVGSRKPSAARHFLLGSTAEKLVRHSHASVLVVR